MAYRLIIRRRFRRQLTDILLDFESAPLPIRHRLERDVDAALEHMTEWPGLGHRRHRGFRTVKVGRFKYLIWFQTHRDEETIVVHGIIHMSQDPKYWPA